ncbi:MAG: pyruvate dehydrogenase complex E1 component subunit beta [Rhodospirillales bacterium]|jgi:pyruvate dehydrogenase E1 component beta subunit|nr:pyruvate dehydrogenase complex E1 component subunit beta [Rhodospirillales bacterium]MBT4006016.1 pyruvate dehydrogenase complex E1 component subunit beta [Rhodospirillales bacterium]MBT5112759.1 pyruvate dehydrogenase complex E1 component subunit beta [Rhodospirillales bacterium]MBT5673529.1 pyruvate dehydrogenase complex E1 component subunit beta [Rhodospirillales bacterium]MBT6741987.1 pyruvate dehydrogenase complex E1 component subunit beta [Rhodospirillales bacterium]
MSSQILMPALSPTMTEGKISKWLKKEGDAVRPGDLLAEIETDKAAMEVEASEEGIIAQILIAEGTEHVAVNTPIAVLAEEGEDVARVDATEAKPAEAAEATEATDAEAAPAAPAAAPASVVAPAAPIVLPPSDVDPAFYANTTNITVREALRDAMAEEMRRDDAVFLMGEEVAEYQGAYKVSQGLLDEFGPLRVVDTPITEQGFTGLGVGSAFAGLKPIVEFMTFNFSMQAMDQIINSAAKTRYMSGGQMDCSMVFRGANGSASRVGAQHSQCFASWFSHIPGVKVLSPFSADDAKGLLKAAIRDPNPVIFLENEILYGRTDDVPVDPDFVVPIGKARVVREGSDVTIVTFSRMVQFSLEAAAQLSAEGIEAEVIDLRSLRPLDTETIAKSIAKTNRVVAVEEGWPYAGIGSEIAARVMETAFDDLDAPLYRVCAADVPLPYAANLEALALPGIEEVIAGVRAVMYRD